MTSPALQTPNVDRTGTRLALAVIVIGVALRIWVLSQRGSLWLDEASLVLNVLGRDFGALATPLDWGQAAPVGFLWLEKGLAALLGPREWVLRLWPFLASVGGLGLTWWVGKRLVGPVAALLATVGTAASLLELRYAAEAKPYASDAFVALGVVALVIRLREQPLSSRRWALLGAGGVAAVLFSLPSVFVLAAVGCALLPDLKRAGMQVRAVAFAVGLAWLATFGALWILMIRDSSGGGYLREYWAPVMLDPRAPDFVARLIRAVASAAATPLRWTGDVPVALTLVALWVAGAALAWRRGWQALALLVGPFLIAALASVAGVYPLSDRLAAFAIPGALLIVAIPVAWILDQAARRVGERVAPAIVLVSALALGAWVAMDSARIVKAPGTLEPTRALFAGVRTSADSTGAGVYVFARAVPAWVYTTTDWKAPDRDRLTAFLEAAGSTDAQGHENFARRDGVMLGDAEGMVAGAVSEMRAGRMAFTKLEFIGLAAGVRYRIAGAPSAEGPSRGWAEEEARRIGMLVDGTFAGTAWIVGSHFFEGTPRDELQPLIAAVRAKGFQIVEERRGGRDAIALRVAMPAPTTR